MATPLALSAETEALLYHDCKTTSKDLLHQPGPDVLDRYFVPGYLDQSITLA